MRESRWAFRFTVNKHNLADVPAMFDLLRKEKIERMCFYHLVYTGRGSKLREEDLTHKETRKLIDLIAAKTKKMFDDGLSPEILTVDNHADGPYLYLKMKKENPERAKEVSGTSGDERGQLAPESASVVSAGTARFIPISSGAISRWAMSGKSPFSEIWTDEKNELLMKLKDKKKHVHGRCAGMLLA